MPTASVTVPSSGGTVVAGRSLREVEQREGLAFQIAALARLVMIATLAATALVAALVWPSEHAD